MGYFTDPLHDDFSTWILGFAPYSGGDVGEIAQPFVLEFQAGQVPFGNLARVPSVAVCATQLHRRVVVHGQTIGVRVTAEAPDTLPVDLAQRLVRRRRRGRT